eukprot:209003_1
MDIEGTDGLYRIKNPLKEGRQKIIAPNDDTVYMGFDGGNLDWYMWQLEKITIARNNVNRFNTAEQCAMSCYYIPAHATTEKVFSLKPTDCSLQKQMDSVCRQSCMKDCETACARYGNGYVPSNVDNKCL